MGGDGEEGAGQLPDARLVEILQILARQNHAGLLLAHPLEAVADVGNCHRIGEPQVQLIDGGHRIPGGEQLVGHIGQHTEQQGVPQVLGRILQALDTEHQEPGRRDIGVAVEEPGVRTLAHGVEPQHEIPEHSPRIEFQFLLTVIVLIGLLNGVVEVSQDGVVGRSHPGEVGGVADAPLTVEPLHHQLQGVDVGGVEILVDTEDVPQEGDVLGQQSTPEGVWRVRVIRLAAIVPVPGLQQIDADPAAEQIHKAAPQVAAQLLHLMLRIQGDNGLAGLQHIAQQELQKVALALPAVAQDQGAGVGLVAGSPIQVHNDIGTILLVAQIEAAGIRLA